jgi:membrane protein YdbS with pleckstrin-like domain
MTPDTINGLYEFGGAFAIMLSVRHLRRTKRVRGVSFAHVAFFTSWGLWNLWFYPSLDQWFSFAGGLALVVVNAIWLLQILHYNRKERSCVSTSAV